MGSYKDEFLLKMHAHRISAVEFSEADIDVLLNQSLDEFLDCFSQRTGEVFYRYTFLPESEFIINGDSLNDARGDAKQLLEKLCPHLTDLDWYLDDMIAGIFDEKDPELADYVSQFTALEKKLCREICAYDNAFDRTKLNHPIQLEVFVLLQGRLVGVREEYDWHLHDESMRPASQVLLEILVAHQEEAEAAEQELRKKRKAAETRLTNYLRSCPKFKSCKNKDLRRNFAMDLWQDPDFTWLHEVFSTPYGPYFNLFDMAYYELK